MAKPIVIDANVTLAPAILRNSRSLDANLAGGGGSSSRIDLVGIRMPLRSLACPYFEDHLTYGLGTDGSRSPRVGVSTGGADAGAAPVGINLGGASGTGEGLRCPLRGPGGESIGSILDCRPNID